MAAVSTILKIPSVGAVAVVALILQLPDFCISNSKSVQATSIFTLTQIYSTCRWEQIYLEVHLPRQKEYKQVNKQTKAEAKERSGKQEKSGNGERENGTNRNDNESRASDWAISAASQWATGWMSDAETHSHPSSSLADVLSCALRVLFGRARYPLASPADMLSLLWHN